MDYVTWFDDDKLLVSDTTQGDERNHAKMAVGRQTKEEQDEEIMSSFIFSVSTYNAQSSTLTAIHHRNGRPLYLLCGVSEWNIVRAAASVWTSNLVAYRRALPNWPLTRETLRRTPRPQETCSVIIQRLLVKVCEMTSCLSEDIKYYDNHPPLPPLFFSLRFNELDFDSFRHDSFRWFHNQMAKSREFCLQNLCLASWIFNTGCPPPPPVLTWKRNDLIT